MKENTAMRKSIQLQVPQPCHEHWDKMDKIEKGRFCLACRKQVIDFSLMTDQEILEYFSHTNDHTCGRFSASQLNRDIEARKKKELGWFRYFIHIMIPALIITNKSNAQAKITGDTIAYTLPVLSPKPINEVLNGSVGMVYINKKKKFTIEGKVTNERGEPIAYVTVSIKGSKPGALTDSNGIFKIVSDDIEHVAVIASSIGYETKETIVNVAENQKTELVLVTLKPTVLGEVVVAGYTLVNKKIDTTVFQRVKNMVKKIITPDTVKIYPNPVSSGSMINIEFNTSASAEYSIAMMTIAGQPVMEKKMFIESGKRVEQLNCGQSIVHGLYTMQVINLSTRKIFASKILVL